MTLWKPDGTPSISYYSLCTNGIWSVNSDSYWVLVMHQMITMLHPWDEKNNAEPSWMTEHAHLSARKQNTSIPKEANYELNNICLAYHNKHFLYNHNGIAPNQLLHQLTKRKFAALYRIQHNHSQRLFLLTYEVSALGLTNGDLHLSTFSKGERRQFK